MTLVIETDQTPLSADADGVVRVNGTRVTLDTVVGAFEEGATAEEIALRYTTLRLADIYSVVGYYLRHQEEVRAYLEQRDAEAERIQRENEARWNPVGIRERLLARQTGQKR